MPDPTDPLSPGLLDAVNHTLDRFLSEQAAALEEIGVTALLPVARDVVGGGKRLRPAFCYWGYVAANGRPAEPAPLLAVAASLDLLHVSALVHDDLIDDSDTRRGLPAAHKRFETLHARSGGRGDAAQFGRSAAIILGDLLLMWSIQLAESSGAARLDDALPLLNAMRAEVTAGQYLDIAAQYQVAGASDFSEELAVAERVLEFKSARYSILRPAQIGAALGGADQRLHDALRDFGSAIGRAFQLRDDILGIFGDPAVTGKPAGGDLREGKRTVLVLKALAAAEPAAAKELTAILGAPGITDADVERAAALIDSTGARDEVESFITAGTDRAIAIVNDTPMTDEGRTALTQLALRSVRRVN